MEGVVEDMGTGTVWGGSGKGRGVEKGGYYGSAGGGLVVDKGTVTVWGGLGMGMGVEKGGYDGSGDDGLVEGVVEGR